MAGKMRSPNYPALSLPQAVEAAERLWKREKRTPVSNDAAAVAMGFRSLSGPARVTIGALRQYGLIDKPDKGHIRLSDLAVRILHGSPDDQPGALRDAALNPELFSELVGSHTDASENAIRSYLLTKKGFAEDGARKAAKAFRETLALAKPEASGYTTSHNGKEPEDMTGMDTGQFWASDAAKGGSSPKPTVRLFSWPLAKGVTAELRLTGDDLKTSHLEMLRQYLELAKTALDSDDE